LIKKIYITYVIFFILVFLILKYIFGLNAYNYTLSLQNDIKMYYQQIINDVQDLIDTHFYQQQTIISLKKHNQQLEQIKIISDLIQEDYNSIIEAYDLRKTTINLKKVKAISFVNISSTSRLWIDFPEFNSSKIYGLVYKDYTAGIVSKKNNQAIAFLNKDSLCSYSVVIGKNKILGIMIGGESKISKNIIIDFIPPWKKINIGDEVRTSGLDDIFTANIKVGKVIKIEKVQGYTKAIVTPYFESHIKNKYFYLIDI